jgi:hypothetical protein
MFQRPHQRNKDDKEHRLRSAVHKRWNAGCIVMHSCAGSTTAYPHSQLKDLLILADAITPHNHDTLPDPHMPVERNVTPCGDGSEKQ